MWHIHNPLLIRTDTTVKVNDDFFFFIWVFIVVSQRWKSYEKKKSQGESFFFAACVHSSDQARPAKLGEIENKSCKVSKMKYACAHTSQNRTVGKVAKPFVLSLTNCLE